ncbi:type II toxin-antitoxin system VapB family antitoxin [Acidiphilium sp. AL]|uniref:Type II toxin-antitoxin system VapB family antitoxin n=1 Tax=Acidiphilium iwatense TaxID=768198 RepID=A0ABS9DTN1_9PROT|nr:MULTISPECIES: type II toxin-antitoxin system VapB family antitoxin [Acidiphilium]MCF3945086.1 type II toxin-antitoxin system VapB family antitoxin [Acidiphilium iwatense]MCU4160569.1 type II toxin-antitoxin system VapB family antitoxin [Acidiphilium sp. AL]
MPLFIKDDETAALVAELAQKRHCTKQDAVKQAVRAALDHDREAIPLRERLRQLWAEHPLPPKSGLVADKAFFDDLSGEP